MGRNVVNNFRLNHYFYIFTYNHTKTAACIQRWVVAALRKFVDVLSNDQEIQHRWNWGVVQQWQVLPHMDEETNIAWENYR